MTEEVMLQMAEMVTAKPIDSWDIQSMQRKLMALKESSNKSSDDDFDSED